MKMHEITNEDKRTAAVDLATKLGGKAWSGAKDLAGKVFNWNEKNVYSAPVQKTADEIAAKNAERAARRQPSELAVKNAEDELARIATTKADVHAVTPKGSKLPVPKDEYVNTLNRTIASNNPIINKNSPIKAPDFDKVSKLRYTAPAVLTDLALGKATSSTEDPEGYSAIRGIAGLAKDFAVGTAQVPGKIATGLDKGVLSAEPEGGAATSARDPSSPRLEENITDILKLSGVKSITQRDNISGMTKVKEIKQLNESTELNECGMGMPSSGNTTASLSINATAGSGEEVANMLKSLMDLAGVKPVTGDMLGSETTPMPMIKAIDIISKPHDHDHDSMEPQEDELNKKPLTGSMEEEYANTPADPKDVPKFDNDKYAHQPNQPQQGDRMDGNMPKGNPKVSEGNLAEALLKEYEAFKNGQ